MWQIQPENYLISDKMTTALMGASSPYKDEREESIILERFSKMQKRAARDALKRFIREGQTEMAFDLVYKNRYAALYVVNDKELASIEGKGWNLGLHAVLFQSLAKEYIRRHPHSDVARLRVDSERSKWAYSIIEQARI